jgi:predicted nuclease of restriction endonuclease-like (RecB) superfamily
MNFELLVDTISKNHSHFQQQASKAINVSLTLRNWLIGFYIVEFEQKGEDRAKYGTEVIEKLAASIQIKGLGSTNLKTMRIFYQTYKSMAEIIQSFLPPSQAIQIRQSPTDEFVENRFGAIGQSATDENKEEGNKYLKELINKISFTHFVELLKIQDENKRHFFEMLIIKTTPTVKELKRQIYTLAYERLGLSTNLEQANQSLLYKIAPEKPEDAIKTIYTFDFLGFTNNVLIEENTLENALINHLQEFIQELGQGFCFEQRQKRMLIDDEYFFADLVFYHRILKCHVIVELKVDAFKHEYLSQLNTYVAYYNAEVKLQNDNAAIGILLCTEKGKKLVEYATAGMDNHLFVSKYLLELPKKEQLEAFIQKELRDWK